MFQQRALRRGTLGALTDIGNVQAKARAEYRLQTGTVARNSLHGKNARDLPSADASGTNAVPNDEVVASSDVIDLARRQQTALKSRGINRGFD